MEYAVDPSPGEPRWLDAEQQRTWRALVLGTTLLTHKLDEELRREFSLSFTEYEILVRLSEADGRQMRMAHLADSLCLSRSRITHTVARMESSDLVVRAGTREDGRGVLARMTDTGFALIERAAPQHVESVRRHLVDLASPEDLAALGRVMNAVADVLVPQNPVAEIR